MKASELVRWCLLFAGMSVAMPGVRRRQATTSSDTCTCPANGPVTTTLSQYTVVTYSTTVTTEGGTAYTTDPTTEVVTVSSTSTVTITTDTTTITLPGVTQTTTTSSTTTSTITATVTQTTCVTAATRKIKRQATTSSGDAASTTDSATSAPSVTTITATSNSKPYTCICRAQATTSIIASTSTCSCPATTDTTITFTEDYTSTTTVSVVSTTPTVATITSTVVITTTVSSFSTEADLATVETTQSSVTETSQALLTAYTTFTATVYSCPTSSSTSTSTTQSSTSSTTSSAAAASSSGSLSCNSTAYLIGTSDSVPKLYNINLANSVYFVINSDVGDGKYTNINGMGYNVLDNYLYAIATISSTTYAVIRITATGSTTEILQFTSSTTSPGTSGDIDTSGQFWFAGSGGTVWRQVDLYPGSSTYGTIVASGTSTLSGYGVYDWVYLPGQGEYQWSLAASTTSSPFYALLRWSHSTHVWSVYQNYTSYSAPYSIIANWAADNSTIWGLAATSGQTTRVTVGGTPVVVGTAPSGVSNADGARCALSD